MLEHLGRQECEPRTQCSTPQCGSGCHGDLTPTPSVRPSGHFLLYRPGNAEETHAGHLGHCTLCASRHVMCLSLGCVPLVMLCASHHVVYFLSCCLLLVMLFTSHHVVCLSCCVFLVMLYASHHVVYFSSFVYFSSCCLLLVMLCASCHVMLCTSCHVSSCCVPLVMSCVQKVDMYSLGVIFFEMCHPPTSTEMERHQLLTALRKDQPELPKFFNEYKMKKKVCSPRPLMQMLGEGLNVAVHVLQCSC